MDEPVRFDEEGENDGGMSFRLKHHKVNILGDPKVTANNHATFVIQIQRRLRDYLRLLMVRTLIELTAVPFI